MFKKILVSILVLFISCQVVAAEKEKTRKFAERGDVQRFINDMYVKHHFNAWELKQLFKTISPDPKVLAAMTKPAEALPWSQYRDRLITSERIEAGVQFWAQNQALLNKIATKYGIPPELIVAIIGIETRYGKTTGSFPVFQTLATLAFDYPPRAKFFRAELEQFLLLAREENLNVKTVLGSYTGAMGIAQFIPSSYRRYAIDYTGSGHRDLMNNMGDIFASIANYLKENGWQAGEQVAIAAAVYGSEFQRLVNKDPQPKLTLSEFAQFNIRPKDKNVLKNKANQKAAFIVLNENTADVENWLTLNNFYVITRYNRSINYAMAVYLLSQKLRDLYSKQGNIG